MRKGDTLPVIPEESWENECYIDSLSAWYDTKYYSQRLIEKYEGRRQILLPIKDPEPQILKNRSKRSGNEIKTVPPPSSGFL